MSLSVSPFTGTSRIGLQGCVINDQNVAISGKTRPRAAGTKWLGEGMLYLLSDPHLRPRREILYVDLIAAH